MILISICWKESTEASRSPRRCLSCGKRGAISRRSHDLLALTARADPVLAELWGNEKDAAYESLGHEAQTCESSLWLETKGRAIMSTAEMLQSVQYVVYPDGRPAAVQMSMDIWNTLLAWLEDVEDRALGKAVLPKLRQGPQRSGALRWEDVKGDWNATQTG